MDTLPAGWKPIESAPKYTEVLVWRDDAGVFIAQLTTPDGVMTDAEQAEADLPDDFEEWFSPDYGWQEGDERPTHWMPLPAAPRSTSSAPGDARDGVTMLPDGSAFALASFPLPASHWLYAEREYAPGAEEPKELPAPILTHTQRDAVVAAVRYAVRGATMCGKEQDFDPDALVQNAVYALCGPYGSAAPAAGDAQDAQRYRWLRDQEQTDAIAIVMKNKHFDDSRTCADNIDQFIDTAIAAQVPQQGEA